MYYITFDPYYDFAQYNDFITNATKNGVPFKQFISTQNNFKWYIGLENKSDFPNFLKFDGPLKDNRWLLEKITPINTTEQNYLLRRQTVINNLEKFCSPKIFKDAKSAEYCCILRYDSIDLLKRLSLKKSCKFWILGKQKNYKLAFTFSKTARDEIPDSFVLIEKNNKSDYSKPGELELALNQKWLIGTGLTNKLIHYPYIQDGNSVILKYPTGFFG